MNTKILNKIFNNKFNNSGINNINNVLNILYPDVNIVIDKIKKVYAKKKYNFFESGVYNLNIIGIRNIAEVNKFNDIIVLIFKDEFNIWRMYRYDATTDPGSFYLNNLLHSNGTAILKEGQWRGVYSIGIHKGEEALIQTKPVTIYRDNNKDLVLDFNSEETGIFGINIHGTTENYFVDINKWSAGCQVILNKHNFMHFMSIIKFSQKYWNNSFTYTLLNVNDFIQN